MARWEHKTKIVLALFITLSLGLFACGDDEGNIGEGQNPGLDVQPDPLSFGRVTMNEAETETVTLENNGEATLNINELSLEEKTGDEFDDKRELRQGDGWDVTSIEPDEQAELEVVYRPRNRTPDEGTIYMETNLPDDEDDGIEDGIFEVPVETSDLAPELTPSPSEVDFDGVDEGESEDAFLTVRNDGHSPLEIDDMWVSGNEAFEYGIPDVSSNEDEDDIPPRDEDSKQWPESIEPNEEFMVRVTFSPEDRWPKEGKLHFESNDPDATTTVDLNGNSGDACMGVPDTVDFDTGALEETSTTTIPIENCSRTEDLEVSEINLTDDGGGVFSIDEESLPGDLPDDQAVIETGERADFKVNFEPDAEEEYTGEITVDSNDDANEEATIELTGNGLDNDCPVSQFNAQIEGGRQHTAGGERNASPNIDALPLDTVTFDASDSSDPDGSVERYQWTILDRPDDSTQRMQPNDDEQSELFLDVAGTYEIELKVYDDKNTVSCNSEAIITIEARPEDDVHIQLVWDTPADPDETDDTGTDLDLHYLHPNGTWNEEPWDVYWRNQSPDWGQDGDSSDDPSLDIDDTDGAGPENINHSNLENKTYRTGVYYYSDEGFGPSYATVRIFVDGELAREMENKHMPETGVFWDVATIEWPGKDVAVVDRISNGFP